MILAARAALLHPEGDGHYAIQRIRTNWSLNHTP
jgi:hypothetical protein